MSQSLNELLLNKSTANITPTLEGLALQDSERAIAFGITPTNVKDLIQARLNLFHAVYPDFVSLCKQLKLSPLPIESLWNLWLPLAMQIAQWRHSQNQPLIQGFLGGQGVGKTTLTAILTLILKQLGYDAIRCSIDDLYLPYHDRLQLQAQDPRLIRRGPPGTHDLQLGFTLLQQFHQGAFPIKIPRFDKSAWQGAGDRVEPEIISSADILLFEGWFVGARPIDPILFETAPAPIKTEADRQFARDMNDRLREYLPLWEELDRLIILHSSNYQLSKQWRKQAEHKMIAQGNTGMTDLEIEAFVEYFWKALHPELLIEPLTRNSDWVDLVIEINSDHTPGKVYQPKK